MESKTGLETRVEPWSLVYNDYDPAKEKSREALLAIGNGYFGTRGAMDETLAGESNYPGTYISGLYNKLTSIVSDKEIQNEDFVNCPNWVFTTFKINDGDWVDMNDVTIESIHRNVNFKNGLLQREMVIKDRSGKKSQINSYRIAGMDNPHLAAMKYVVTPLNYSGKVTIRTGLNGNIINEGVERYKQLNQFHLSPVSQKVEKNSCSLLVKTTQSGIEIAESARVTVYLNGEIESLEFKSIVKEGEVYLEFEADIEENSSLAFEKLVGIYTSKNDDVTDPLVESINAIDQLNSLDELIQRNGKAWSEIWDKVDIEVDGDPYSQMLIRLHIYHLICTTSDHNSKIDFGIPARGLHGEAYRGHVFWDELYILPIYYMHFPEAAKSVLKYRYNRLDEARKYAKEYGYKGAMFPWQSGSEGVEETQIIHLNPVSGKWGDDYSSLQRHISIAVAYNVWNYVHYTEDFDFLISYGAEVYLEICRFWASKCSLNKQTGRYDIDKVMGPDEFHEKYADTDHGGLKNNSYTNIMVTWLFQKAFEMISYLKENDNTVLEKINLSDQEVEKWENIAGKLTLEISSDGIISQFKGYFELDELDWDYFKNKYGNIHRMDRLLKAEGKSPDDYKVAKQADTLMTFFLLPEGEIKKIVTGLGYKLPDDYLEKNFDYYIQRTSHGSTLSRVVHAYLAQILGKDDIAWKYYMDSLESDYNDIQGGTTGEGIHAGVMGSTVLAPITSFTGINFIGDYLEINPRLPKLWKSLKFNFHFKKNHYKFEIENHQIKLIIHSSDNKNIKIFVDKKEWLVKTNKIVEIDLNK